MRRELTGHSASRGSALGRARVRLPRMLEVAEERVEDIIKAIMCGASVVQVVSHLLKNGASSIGPLIEGLRTWLVDHEYESIEQMRGSMSHQHCPDPSVFERANYLRVLQLWKI